MSDGSALARRAVSNLEAARMDLAAAFSQGDEGRARLLETLLSSGGRILIYRPQLQHYAVLFGDIARVRHVAVVVPGVGDGTNMCDDWIPGALNLYRAAESLAVVLWKGYDNPPDLLDAATESLACDADLMAAGGHLAGFVAALTLRGDQSLTMVAHSYGSVVTGAALADHELRCTDVVVAGSPGMTVDDLRQLHVEAGHFFSEKAPGDAVAELGIFGAAPTSSLFGGTRMRTNDPERAEVHGHSHYFEPGSEALANIAAVATGRYDAVSAHHWSLPEIAGGAVSWTLRLPTLPVRIVGRHYRGPGFRVAVNALRLCDLGAAQTGNLVREAIDEGERALAWAVRRAGVAWRPFSSPDEG